MIIYLEYKSIEDVYHYIISKHNFDPSSMFGLSRVVDKSNLVEWGDINQLGSDSIFDDTNNPQLVDISNLNISTKIKSINTQTSTEIYLYSPDKRKLPAAEKKLLEKAGFDYIKVPTLNTQEVNKYIETFSTKLNTKPTQATIDQVSQITDSLLGICNYLEIISTIGNQNQYLSAIKESTPEPLFKQYINPGNKKNVKIWYDQLNSDEIQLNISLLHTKLSKNYNNKPYIKKLIELDKNIKTHSTTKPAQWYKYFLWQLTH